ncbi:hypothetical protein [Dactylosporangium sp. NPDC051541]|uniref:hypothetical protein n=1 Tax=Dactylosporangium sp. NPDC051541 TaxID=3363977 RepID=UPI0037BA41E4
MTYPPTGDPSQNQYYGGYPPPPGASPTGGYPAQPEPGPPSAPGYPPPQYAPPPQYPPQQPQYPPQQPEYAQQPGGYPPSAPATQGWQQPQPPPTQGWQQQQQPPTQGWQQAPATQGWQAPPPGAVPGGSGGPRSSMPWLPIGVIAGIVLLAVIGGVVVITKLVSSDEPSTPEAGSQPGATTAAAPTTGGAPTGKPSKTSTSAAATPAKYAAAGDLCSTDLSALGIYSAKKEKSTPNVRNTGGVARSDCDFDLRTASGMKVTFGIKTQVYPTSKEAKSYFDSGYDLDKQRYFDADLSGMGERSYGTNRDWDIGSKTSDYTIRVLDSNLYLSISLVTFGSAFVPKDQLKPKAIDEVKAILAKLPQA